MRDVVVISLGGSVLVPEDVDFYFLKEFKEMVISFIDKYKFVIVVGGGKTARRYQSAGKELGLNDEALDWMGIYATWINAELVKITFEEKANKEIVKDPTKKVSFENILIAGGWKPGWSTDYDAVLLAEQLGAKVVVNMTNVEYLHDKNPNEFPDTKKIGKIDWEGFKKIVGDEWKPGLNMPFDPVAAKKAAELGLKLVLVGKDVENLRNYLERKEFKGSIVKE